MGSRFTTLLVSVLVFGVGFLAPVICRPLPGSADCLMKCCEAGMNQSGNPSETDCCSYKDGNRLPYVTSPSHASPDYQTGFIARLTKHDFIILHLPSYRKSEPVRFATAPPLFLLTGSIRI